MIQDCVRYRRVDVLDFLFPKICSELGFDSAAQIIHGCSPAVVEKHIHDSRILESKRLDMVKLARFHSEIIVSMIVKDISSCENNIEQRQKVWARWTCADNISQGIIVSSAKINCRDARSSSNLTSNSVCVC